MFCKHQWKILSEVKTQSKVELLKDIGVSIKSSGDYIVEVLGRKFIQIVSCEKCGKLKRFVERI